MRQGGDHVSRSRLGVAGDRLVQALRVLAPFPGGHAAGIDGFHAVGLRRPDLPGGHVLGAFEFARLDEVEQDFVVGHQHAAGAIDDRRIVQLLVRVPGGENGYGRLVHGRPAHAGVEIAGNIGGRRRSADAAAAHGSANHGRIATVILGNHRPREIERGAGDVRVNINPARKDDHAGGVDGASAFDIGDDAAIRDADVTDLAVNAVCRVVDRPALDPQHWYSACSVRPVDATND